MRRAEAMRMGDTNTKSKSDKCGHRCEFIPPRRRVPIIIAARRFHFPFHSGIPRTSPIARIIIRTEHSRRGAIVISVSAGSANNVSAFSANALRTNAASGKFSFGCVAKVPTL